jgi:hypothetical protein
MLNKSVNFGLLGLLVAISLTPSVQAQQQQNSPSIPAGELVLSWRFSRQSYTYVDKNQFLLS